MRTRTLMPNFGKRGGILPVVTIDARTKKVLMLAYANEEAFRKTVATGIATYFSTSRQTLWVKGETSGNTQLVHQVLTDCDGDALLYVVTQKGPACHTGAKSCFYRNCIGASQICDAPLAGPNENLSIVYMDVCDELPRRIGD